MRQIGFLDGEADARRFAAFLVTNGTTAHAEQDGAGWAVWVREENQVDKARLAFAEFRDRPDDPRYENVEGEADSILRADAKRREQARRNVIHMRGRWGHGLARRLPLVWTLIALSIGVGLMSNMGHNRGGAAVRVLLFTDPVHMIDPQWNVGDPEALLIDVRQGQLWRLITPIFVHYGPMHLAFNMLMFYQLGGLIEQRRGTWRLGVMTLAIAACSNTAQALVPAAWGGSPFAAGMSGVVYGLFGYVWMKTLYAPELGMAISRSTVVILLAWLLLGFAGLLNRGDVQIANWTHGIGFIAGVVIGYLPELARGRM
jgi:GlpG protein